ncbi:hypothetical protein TNCV_2927971 [Trichonephila clavipes]|nr:hypothetical protein TNCV_2927971 [Trichonephila clavipes]
MDFAPKKLWITLYPQTNYLYGFPLLSYLPQVGSPHRQPMGRPIRSQQSGKNPGVVFCFTQWHHNKWKCKSADLTTRGVSSSTLLYSFNMVVWSSFFTWKLFYPDRLFCFSSLNDAVPEDGNKFKTSSTVLETLAQECLLDCNKAKMASATTTKAFQVNDLCLIKDDNLPPTRWNG